MKKWFKNIDKNWKMYALAGSVCVLVYLVVGHIGLVCNYIGKFLKIFSPVFIGIIIAYIINPFAVWVNNHLFKKLKERKPDIAWILSIVIVFILLLAFIVGLILILIPQVIDSVGGLLSNINYYTNSLESLALKFKEPIRGYIVKYVGLLTAENGLIGHLEDFLKANLDKILSATSSIGSAVVNWGIGLILSLYFICAKKNIINGFTDFYSLAVDKKTFGRTRLFYTKFDTIFSKYIVCELIDALIVGVANFIFMIVCGMPSALMISFVVGITNLAPTFGPIIGAAIGVFLLLLMQPSAILGFLIFTIFIQTADAYLIKPKFFGGALEVPGFLILVAIIVFGKMFGVSGMLLAIPFAAIIVYLFNEILIPRLAAKKYKKEKKQAEETAKE